MLSCDEFPNLLMTLREQFDFIILDSSPVLLVSDSLAISQHVDAVIFSIFETRASFTKCGTHMNDWQAWAFESWVRSYRVFR